MRPETIRAIVPDGLSFDDLDMHVDEGTGEVSFNVTALRRLTEASGIDWSWLTEEEDRIAALLIAWYYNHRERGGSVHLIAEQLAAHAEAIEAVGALRVQRGPITPQ
jgi:hypothetical protein